MKYLLTSILLLTCTFSYSQTQSQLNETESENYRVADSILNEIYRQVLKSYADDPVFIKHLKASQRIWIKYRDTTLQMKYPHPEEYGSVQEMCTAIFLTGMTFDRIATLQIWLDGIEEGDICAGSVKLRN